MDIVRRNIRADCEEWTETILLDTPDVVDLLDMLDDQDRDN